MTVADNTSRNQYSATSGQTVFAYTFEIVDKDDIVVLKNGTTLSEGTDYAVSNVGNDGGGNVTLTVGATTGDVLTLYRDMPYSRTQNYTNSGDFLASEVNSDFDNLWLAGEQTNRAFSQSIRKPITDSDSISMELPEAATRADRFLTFDSTGAVTTTAVSSTTAPQNIYRQQMTGDGTTTVFTLNFDSGSVGGAIVIYIDGVYQEGDTYNASGTSLVFTEAPPTNASIEVMYFKVSVAADIDATGTIYSQQFTGNGSTTAYTLGIPPGSTGKALQVFINGVYQDQGSYTVSGATLTFSEAPPTTSQIDVIAFRIKEIGATDANLVTYTPAGTGAVPATVQTKLRETVSVKDFGAVGDGVADDTAAINSAIEAQQTNGGAVRIPAGTYKISSTITLRRNVPFIGDGSTSVTFEYSGSSFAMQVGDAAFRQTSDGTRQGWTLKGFKLTGTSSASAGIFLCNCHGDHFEDIVVNGFTQTGAEGFLATGTPSVVGESSPSSVVGLFYCTFRDCYSFNNHVGIIFTGVTGEGTANSNLWIGGAIRQNIGANVEFAAESNSNVIRAASLETTGETDTGVVWQANTLGNTVADCRFEGTYITAPWDIKSNAVSAVLMANYYGAYYAKADISNAAFLDNGTGTLYLEHRALTLNKTAFKIDKLYVDEIIPEASTDITVKSGQDFIFSLPSGQNALIVGDTFGYDGVRIPSAVPFYVPAASTASRPTANLVGAHYFDTTLGKPIWWNGSSWRDATGAAV